MFNAETFPYISADSTPGEAGFRPYRIVVENPRALAGG